MSTDAGQSPASAVLEIQLIISNDLRNGVSYPLMNTLAIMYTTLSFQTGRHWAVTASIFLMLAATAPSAMLPDAKPRDFPANAGRHVISIRRDAADEIQKKMITAAEVAVPDKRALQMALGDTPVAGDENQWWYQEQLGIRIPFAITGAAVEYYSKLIDGYQKQAFKRYMEPSSKLDYHAGVAFHQAFEIEGKTFKDVHVVVMKLTFSENFAATTTEGMEFKKQRTVVLDAKGTVLAVSGDGPTEVPVLAI